MKLRVKLVIICLIISLVPLFFVALLGYNNVRGALLLRNKNFLRLVLDNKIANIKDELNVFQEKILVKDNFLVRSSLAIISKSADKIDESEHAKAVNYLEAEFRGLVTRHEKISDIIFVDPAGVVVYDFNKKITEKSIDKIFYGFGKLAFENGKNKIYSSDLYPDVDGSGNFLVSGPVYSLNNVFLGVLMLDIDASSLLGTIKGDYRIYNSLETIVVRLISSAAKNTDQEYIYNQNGDTAMFLNPLRFDDQAAFNRTVLLDDHNNSIWLAIAGKPGYGSDIDYRGKKVFLAWDYLPETNWGILVKIDESEILSSLHTFSVQMIFFGLICAFAIFLLAWLIALLVYAPFSELIKAAEEIGNGVFDVSFDKKNISAKDEFGIVSRTFLKTSEKLKNLFTGLNKDIVNKTLEVNEKNKYLDQQKRALISLLEDVELEKSKAEGLVSDLEKFRLAMENSSDQIVITDSEGIVLFGNKMVEEITGYKLDEIIGKKAGVLWRSPMPMEYYKKFWDTIKNKKKIFIGEIENRRKNGEEYTAAINVSPVLDKKGEVVYFVGVERDITKEKQIDRAKTEFVSLISHQLRTPLTAISLFSEMLVDKDLGELNTEQLEYIQNIRTSNQRMILLVNSILNVSRLDMGTFIVEPKDTDVAALAQSVINEQTLIMAEKNLKFSQSIDKEIPIIKTDPDQLRMVFQNLLSNAVNYTPKDKSIEFNMAFDKLNKKIFIEVKDSGIGIPKNQQSEIFGKLFRANNARLFYTNGNGLGLYIIKTILEQLGGSIRFESEENVGTTFFVSLSTAPVAKKSGKVKLS